MTTDFRSTFDDDSSIKLVGGDMAKKCSQKVYKKVGIDYNDVCSKIDVCELHDCFSANELCTYEALGLCKKGTAH